MQKCVLDARLPPNSAKKSAFCDPEGRGQLGLAVMVVGLGNAKTTGNVQMPSPP
jgi:hypothetical protein